MKSGLKKLIAEVKKLGSVVGRKSLDVRIQVLDGDVVDFNMINSGGDTLKHLSMSPNDPLGAFSEQFVSTFHTALLRRNSPSGPNQLAKEPAKSGDGGITSLYRHLEKPKKPRRRGSRR